MTESNPGLREFLAEYEAARPDDVWHVKEPVNLQYDITAHVLELEKRGRAPVLVFENLIGHPGTLVANVFGSRDRIAAVLGTDVEQLHQTWRDRTSTLLAPEWIGEGPVQEVCVEGADVDLGALSIPKHFQDDAGHYLCSGVCVANDPDTGVPNLAFARMQVKGRNKLGISMHSKGHLWDYFRRAEERNEALDVSVVIGAHPTVMLASGSRAGIDVDEYEIAGALAGRPVQLVKSRTNNVGVPANAEIVVEGRILPRVREPEGPFGEYAGYSTSRSTENVLEVTAITSRKNPIYLSVTPGLCSDHLLLDRVQKEATMSAKLREVVSDVRQVHYPNSGTLFHAYVSLDKKLEGQATQAATLLLGLDQYLKLVVVVDPDIDLADEAHVLWAIATRVQADRDVTVIERSLCNVLDPSSNQGMSAKMIVDATAPLDWDATPLRLPGDSVAAARESVSHWLRSGR
jgi:2,5-furandicarboxylate decarboxylase 1